MSTWEDTQPKPVEWANSAVLASKVSAGCSMLAYIFLFNDGPAVAFAVDPPSFARVHRRVACAYVSRGKRQPDFCEYG